MAAPMTAAEFLACLRAEGLTVRETKGWRTHNRNHRGAWGPLHGVMMHHTAGHEEGALRIVSDGYDGLPGPLCHGLIHKDGSIDAVGWGRANHAGAGDPDVLAAVTAQRYPLPKTDKHEGEAGAVDGNPHFIGYEAVNLGDGKDPWPYIQLEAMARAVAGPCRVYGWSVDSVIRHLDWSDWKSDPRGVDWGAFRTRVADILAGKPNATKISEWVDGKADPVVVPKPDPKPVPKPDPLPVVSVSRIVAAARRDPSGPQGRTTWPVDVRLVESALDRLNLLSSGYAKDGSFGTATVRAYAAYQRSLGYRGTDANGIPGKASLTALGTRTKLFTVKN